MRHFLGFFGFGGSLRGLFLTNTFTLRAHCAKKLLREFTRVEPLCRAKPSLGHIRDHRDPSTPIFPIFPINFRGIL